MGVAQPPAFFFLTRPWVNWINHRAVTPKSWLHVEVRILRGAPIMRKRKSAIFTEVNEVISWPHVIIADLLESAEVHMNQVIPIKLHTWSYSRLTVFEQCPQRAKLQYIDRIPEPPRPLPPGKTEHANDRGTRVHEAAELYVKGGVELLPELSKFEPEFKRLRDMYAAGQVSLEGEWALDNQWLPIGWNDPRAWLRLKLDAMVRLTPEHGVVIDYKTGRLKGNEVKHMEQGQLYQLATFLRYPDIQKVDVEFWYTDLDEMTRVTYTREQGLRFLAAYERRGKAITDCLDFAPNPNSFSCKWCPYKPTGTGHCKVGV